MNDDILNRLYDVLQSRKSADPESSYVASLYKKGVGKMSGKLTEEAEETIAEALRLEKSPEDQTIRGALRSESADLIFHLMVMLSHHDIPPGEVFAVLEERFGMSGLEEKASRKTN
ncbi:MAG: phosphoribosyl-ATP diphosphatase [Alphaproteobacteria bacterium]|nr:phosphoribosyl-ATP diphosphatase [Alphaproteobacteria bacterium]